MRRRIAAPGSCRRSSLRSAANGGDRQATEDKQRASRFRRLFDAANVAIGTLALIGLLGMPATALAAGMPQLEFNNPLTLAQVAWGAVIFIVFFLLCWLWGLPQVGHVLERRAASIAADLDAARAAKEAADRSIAEMTRTITEARAEAQASINAALDAAKQQAAAQAAELNARLESELHDAEERIHAARRAAMRALRDVASDTASAIVARLTGASAEPSRLHRAVDAVLAAREPG